MHIERPVQECQTRRSNRADEVRTTAGSHLAAGELQVLEAHRGVLGRALCNSANEIKSVSLIIFIHTFLASSPPRRSLSYKCSLGTSNVAAANSTELGWFN